MKNISEALRAPRTEKVQELLFLPKAKHPPSPPSHLLPATVFFPDSVSLAFISVPLPRAPSPIWKMKFRWFFCKKKKYPLLQVLAFLPWLPLYYFYVSHQAQWPKTCLASFSGTVLMQLSPGSLPSFKKPPVVSSRSWFLCPPLSEVLFFLTCPCVSSLTPFSPLVWSCLPFTLSYKYPWTSPCFLASATLLFPTPALLRFLCWWAHLLFQKKTCANDPSFPASKPHHCPTALIYLILTTGLTCPHLTPAIYLLRLPSDSLFAEAFLGAPRSYLIFSVHTQNSLLLWILFSISHLHHTLWVTFLFSFLCYPSVVMFEQSINSRASPCILFFPLSCPG